MPAQGKVTSDLPHGKNKQPRVVNDSVCPTIRGCFIYTLFIYMDININSKKTSITSTNLQELAQEMNLPEKGVAMAINNQMIPRTEWANTPIAEGADVIIIKAACGG